MRFRFSKKLIVALVTAAILLLNEKLGLGLNEEQRRELVALAAAYLAGQGLADFGQSRAEPEPKP